jgi:DNA-directed RNA polymerase III subunit RPC8
VRLSLGFFKDVVIPDYALQTPSFFHDAERVWIWKWEGNELHMDPGCEVRFRVSSVRFNPTPTATQLAVSAAAAAAAGAAAPAAGGAAAAAGSSAAAAAAGGAPPLTVHSPMEVIGDIDADGLGVTDWWQPAEEAGDGEAGAAGSDAAL